MSISVLNSSSLYRYIYYSYQLSLNAIIDSCIWAGNINSHMRQYVIFAWLPQSASKKKFDNFENGGRFGRYWKKIDIRKINIITQKLVVGFVIISNEIITFQNLNNSFLYSNQIKKFKPLYCIPLVFPWTNIVYHTFERTQFFWRFFLITFHSVLLLSLSHRHYAPHFSLAAVFSTKPIYPELSTTLKSAIFLISVLLLLGRYTKIIQLFDCETIQ